MRILLIATLTTTLVSCQLSRKISTPNRNIASTSAFKSVITDLKSQLNMSEDQIHQKVLNHLMEETSQTKNFKLAGINKDQAESITSLENGQSFMPKVRKYVLENMDNIFPSADKQTLSQIYNTHVLKGEAGLNPYAAATGRVRNQAQSLSPTFKLQQKGRKLLSEIETIQNTQTKTELKELYNTLKSRSDIDQPEVLANGIEIIESATKISKKTNLKGLGLGCKDFIKDAPIEILESKANVDIYRAELVNNRVPSSIDELDEVTKQALKDVLRLSDVQAQNYLKNLKNAPCKVY